MTLEEKVAQLGSHWVFELADDDGLTTGERPVCWPRARPGDAHLGRERPASDRRRPSSRTPSSATSSSETRLGIPAIVHEEICSGLMARDATVFPQAIGLASTWEPALVEALADAVRDADARRRARIRASARCSTSAATRAGAASRRRSARTLTSSARMGVAFVRGLQGDDLPSGVVATAKHLVGYGASEGGDELGACADLGARSCATSTSIRSRPRSAPPRPLRDERVQRARRHPVRRRPRAADDAPPRQWGFEGCVVSDYFSVRQLADYHQFAARRRRRRRADPRGRAGRRAPEHRLLRHAAPRRGSRRRVDEATIDTAVRRVLRRSSSSGSSSSRTSSSPEASRDEQHAATSARSPQTLARKSLVLLRNDGTLPLRPDVGSVAVIGPCADEARNLFGDYAYPAHVESLQVAARERRDPFGTRVRRRIGRGGARPSRRRPCSPPCASSSARACVRAGLRRERQALATASTEAVDARP